MPNHAPSRDSDKDSLHTLPLSTIPLETAGLRKARLLKNSRLEAVVELFSGAETGSGQFAPEDLGQVFQFDERNGKDLEMIQALSPLPSYDVYSLRIELRRLGISVDDHSSLELSEEKKQELGGYMGEFTRPLVSTIYGGEQGEVRDLADITRLFMNPHKDAARRNLMKMSEALNVEIASIPEFLQTYGDVYLSLAYYQQCLDQNMPNLSAFLESLSELQSDHQLKSNAGLRKTFTSIEKKMKAIVLDIKNILELFRLRTADMWEDISSESLDRVQKMIATYQTGIGGALCAITVKMNAWKDKFPSSEAGSPRRRADFIMSDIRPGIAGIRQLNYAD